MNYLEFEKPLAEIEGKAEELRAMGRSNYFANLGSHGWVYDVRGTLVKDSALAGIFAFGSQTRIAEIRDGTSNTACFAEVKRG